MAVDGERWTGPCLTDNADILIEEYVQQFRAALTAKTYEIARAHPERCRVLPETGVQMADVDIVYAAWKELTRK